MTGFLFVSVLAAVLFAIQWALARMAAWTGPVDALWPGGTGEVVMDAVLQVLPLVVLLIGAGFVVWRGMRRTPDGRNNRERFGANVDAV